MGTTTQPAPPPSIAHRVVNDEPVSVEAYFDFVDAQDEHHRFEYVDGWIIACDATTEDGTGNPLTNPMHGPTLKHGLILSNVGVELGNQLKDGPCKFITGSVRVRIPGDPVKYLCPDLVAFCGQPEETEDRQDTLTNPALIVEVLSPSTKDYDRGEKFLMYRRLESFQDYLVIQQDRPHAEHFARVSDEEWKMREVKTTDAELSLSFTSATLALTDIYRGVLDEDETP